MELTWSAVDTINLEEVQFDRSRVTIVQVVARRSHYPKVVCSILTWRTFAATQTNCFELSCNTAQCAAIPPGRNCRIEDMFLNSSKSHC